MGKEMEFLEHIEIIELSEEEVEDFARRLGAQ